MFLYSKESLVKMNVKYLPPNRFVKLIAGDKKLQYKSISATILVK